MNTGSSGNGGRNCYECGEPRNSIHDCSKLKNDGGRARGRAFVIRGKEAIQDPSVVTGTFLINNVYATILFDFGANKSFITLIFKHLLNHKSNKLDVACEVEVANG